MTTKQNQIRQNKQMSKKKNVNPDFEVTLVSCSEL